MVYKLLKNGEVVNTIVASPAFVDAYANTMGYTYEAVEPEPLPTPEPTQLDIIEAQVTYTAMMTDTLVGGVTDEPQNR